MSASSIDSILNEKNPKQLSQLAKLAEAAERYPDMCKFMHALFTAKCKIIEAERKSGEDRKTELSVEERNLLSVAYKNVVGAKRQSWRMLSQGVKSLDEEVSNTFKNIVEKELENVCNEALMLLKDGPIALMEESPDSMPDEDGVFYLKMAGDYYRYLAEFMQKEAAGNAKNNAKTYYVKAMTLAESKLPETHPTRLGLALNFSVCYYEILKEPKEACRLAKTAFDKAIEKLDTLNDASYKDSTLIMQLLRDNLTLWTSEDNAQADEPN